MAEQDSSVPAVAKAPVPKAAKAIKPVAAKPKAAAKPTSAGLDAFAVFSKEKREQLTGENLVCCQLMHPVIDICGGAQLRNPT